MRVLIVGCGYVGLPLGTALARSGHAVFGLRRSRLAEAALAAAGIEPLHADITQPATLARLPGDFDWVVNCTASGGGSPEDYRKTYFDGSRNLLSWLAKSPPKKFLYTSSTGVYAQNDGSVVTEECAAEPETDTAKVLVATENLLLAAAGDMPSSMVLPVSAALHRVWRGVGSERWAGGECLPQLCCAALRCAVLCCAVLCCSGRA